MVDINTSLESSIFFFIFYKTNKSIALSVEIPGHRSRTLQAAMSVARGVNCGDLLGGSCIFFHLGHSTCFGMSLPQVIPHFNLFCRKHTGPTAVCNLK